MREAVIVSAARTPIGKAYRGYFNATEAPVLAGHVMNAAVERDGTPVELETGSFRRFVPRGVVRTCHRARFLR